MEPLRCISGGGPGAGDGRRDLQDLRAATHKLLLGIQVADVPPYRLALVCCRGGEGCAGTEGGSTAQQQS